GSGVGTLASGAGRTGVSAGAARGEGTWPLVPSAAGRDAEVQAARNSRRPAAVRFRRPLGIFRNGMSERRSAGQSRTLRDCGSIYHAVSAHPLPNISNGSEGRNACRTLVRTGTPLVF